MIATLNTAEQTWWNLTLDQRIHYELCIHAIVYHYRNDRDGLAFFMTRARWYAITSPVIKAIVWRINEELYND